ncbi:hypothetical protein [Mycobacterium sp.]|uniref:hypothetical protein n=1 Tax=Mycobacterium sp. TaxID=1785 RepID=UPI0025F8CCE5|nr:hypothetical protein [Mycobacterium sp.]MBW0012008.1 hypothetical protein [Mycobacterium sp.]
MHSAGLPDERGARAHAGHRLSGAHHRPPRGPRSSTVLTANPSAGDVESMAHDTADRRQAQYFLHLLVQSRHHVDHRLAACRKAIGLAEAAGDTEGASGLRRIACADEKERRTLDRLIENLRLRFPVATPAAAR